MARLGHSATTVQFSTRLFHPGFIPLLALFLAGTLCISCGLDFLFAQDIILQAPDRPNVWQRLGGLEFDVEWRDASGTEQHAMLKEGESIQLRLVRGESQAILLLPRYSQAQLMPAGFIYPGDLQGAQSFQAWTDPAVAKANYGSGYEAMVAQALEKAGYVPWHWPVERLADASLAKGIDPWVLTPSRAASLLIQGSFRLTAFPKPKTPFELPIPGPWYPESPFCQITEAAGDGKAPCAQLAEGVHNFFSESRSLVIKIESGKLLSQEITRSAKAMESP